MKKLRSLLAHHRAQIALIAIVAAVVGFASVRMFQGDKIAQVQCDGTCVYLRADAIEPGEIAVKAGEYVQFNSADGKRHNLTTANSDDQAHGMHGASDAAYASGDFGADEAWRVQFKQPGTYRFKDSYNDKLEVLVVVYESTNP